VDRAGIEGLRADVQRADEDDRQAVAGGDVSEPGADWTGSHASRYHRKRGLLVAGAEATRGRTGCLF
jgi:hypothetical protein